jgi:hypothetical protein
MRVTPGTMRDRIPRRFRTGIVYIGEVRGYRMGVTGFMDEVMFNVELHQVSEKRVL